MGVKGRRVALVEELSKTVISFQKVDTKSKDRLLTITGTTQESIQQAKLLVEDTIKRNVSPIRLLTGSDVTTNQEEEEDEDDPGISIETSKDGTLKLCCADPEVLQAAQAALSDYLNRAHRSSRTMTVEERELRKERRKSMPLQSTEKSCADVAIPKQELRINLDETRRVFTGSTPNLIAQDKLVSLDEQEKETNSTADLTENPAPTLATIIKSEENIAKFNRSEMLALCNNHTDQSTKPKTFAKYVKETMPEIVRNNE